MLARQVEVKQTKAVVVDRVSLALKVKIAALCLDLNESDTQGIMALTLTELELKYDMMPLQTHIEVGLRDIAIRDNWISQNPAIEPDSEMTNFISVILGAGRSNKYVTIHCDMYKEGHEMFDNQGIGMDIYVELKTLRIQWNHLTIGALFKWLANGKRASRPVETTAIEPGPGKPEHTVAVPTTEHKVGAMKVKMMLRGIEMNLNREDKGAGLAGLEIQTVEFGMLSSGNTMKVDVELGNIIVKDLNPKVCCCAFRFSFDYFGPCNRRSILMSSMWPTPEMAAPC